MLEPSDTHSNSRKAIGQMTCRLPSHMLFSHMSLFSFLLEVRLIFPDPSTVSRAN